MHIAVLSHTYIVDLNRDKLRVLASLDKDIRVAVIVPKRWRPGGVQSGVIESYPLRQDNFEVVPLNNFGMNNQGLLSFDAGLFQFLQSFRPQIIQVEQGTKSLAYFETININKVLGLQAKNILFTWWNLPYELKFPLSVLERHNLNNTDGVIAGNKDGLDILRQKGFAGQAVVLPQLGVNEKLFIRVDPAELRTSLGFTNDDFVVGFVGRLVVEKGLSTLIEAMKILQDRAGSGADRKPKLFIIGSGPMAAEINGDQTQVPTLVMNSVPHDEVPKYLNAMNVLVLPSETVEFATTLTSRGWKEQFGHVLIEAMSCEVPVIGSNSGEIPNVIADAGFVFPERDSQALANNLFSILSNRALEADMGAKGRARVLEHYTNYALARAQLNFYNDILAAKPATGKN